MEPAAAAMAIPLAMFQYATTVCNSVRSGSPPPAATVRPMPVPNSTVNTTT